MGGGLTSATWLPTGTLVALLLAGPALDLPGHGAEGPAGGVVAVVFGGALHGQQGEQLLITARQLAGSWASASDRGVTSRLASGRVSLHLEGRFSANIPTRQAVAVLRDYLRAYDRGEVELARVALVEGSSDRGFAEFHWVARRAGTSQTLRHTVFLGLQQESGRWMVTEVRVLP